MIVEQNDSEVAYDTLRRELITILMEQRSQGRFAVAADGTDQERALCLAELTRSIADILAPGGSRARGAALADAQTIASAVLEHRSLAG